MSEIYTSNIISVNEKSAGIGAINYLEVKKAAAILRAINHKLKHFLSGFFIIDSS